MKIFVRDESPNFMMGVGWGRVYGMNDVGGIGMKGGGSGSGDGHGYLRGIGRGRGNGSGDGFGDEDSGYGGGDNVMHTTKLEKSFEYGAQEF